MNKTIIVTGAAKGIGLAIAKKAISKGYQVIGIDIDRDEMKKYKALPVDYYYADLSDEISIIELMENIKKKYSQIHALINNAGIADPNQKPILELSLEDWNKMIATNLSSMFLMVKYFSDLFVLKESSIVNISSIRAFFSEANTEAYSAAKAGVIGLTHALANSFAHKFRVNAISPGWIQTGVSAPHSKENDDEHLVGRIGQVDDVANLVMYLISEEASFITGQNFMLDGGVSVKLPYK